MNRLLVFAAIALIPAFYVGWPAWSAYQIHEAIEAKDAATLERKIDFARVRVSLRDPMTQRMSELYERFVPKTGTLAGRMKQELLPRLVDVSLVALVTPENLIRAASDSGKLKDFVDSVIGDQLIRTGGIPGAVSGQGSSGKPGEPTGKAGAGKGTVFRTVPTVPSGEPTGQKAVGARGPVVRTVNDGEGPTNSATPAPSPPSKLAKIKQFQILGPFRFAMGIAKDPAASEPDITAEMSFTGTDWKVTAVRPKL